MTRRIEIVEPGPLTLVQDLGRVDTSRSGSAVPGPRTSRPTSSGAALSATPMGSPRSR